MVKDELEKIWKETVVVQSRNYEIRMLYLVKRTLSLCLSTTPRWRAGDEYQISVSNCAMWSDLCADRFIRRVSALSPQICTLIGSQLRHKCEVDFQMYIDQSTLRIKPSGSSRHVILLIEIWSVALGLISWSK